eukprot:6173807-Lingulodinium_polyedra.AAC.1
MGQSPVLLTTNRNVPGPFPKAMGHSPISPRSIGSQPCTAHIDAKGHSPSHKPFTTKKKGSQPYTSHILAWH